MKPLPVVFRTQALRDLKGIADYIASHDPAAAARVIQRIHQTIFKTIANFPNGGRLDQKTGTREFPVSGLPYLIIYLPLPTRRCLRVSHLSAYIRKAEPLKLEPTR
jgi:toxin ParE1/3/4